MEQKRLKKISKNILTKSQKKEAWTLHNEAFKKGYPDEDLKDFDLSKESPCPYPDCHKKMVYSHYEMQSPKLHETAWAFYSSDFINIDYRHCIPYHYDCGTKEVRDIKKRIKAKSESNGCDCGSENCGYCTVFGSKKKK